MYLFKNELIKELKKVYKLNSVADRVGITIPYLSSIMNNRYACSKTTAYAITKAFDKDAEIEDYFNKVVD